MNLNSKLFTVDNLPVKICLQGFSYSDVLKATKSIIMHGGMVTTEPDDFTIILSNLNDCGSTKFAKFDIKWLHDCIAQNRYLSAMNYILPPANRDSPISRDPSRETSPEEQTSVALSPEDLSQQVEAEEQETPPPEEEATQQAEVDEISQAPVDTIEQGNQATVDVTSSTDVSSPAAKVKSKTSDIRSFIIYEKKSQNEENDTVSSSDLTDPEKNRAEGSTSSEFSRSTTPSSDTDLSTPSISSESTVTRTYRVSRRVQRTAGDIRRYFSVGITSNGTSRSSAEVEEKSQGLKTRRQSAPKGSQEETHSEHLKKLNIRECRVRLERLNDLADNCITISSDSDDSSADSKGGRRSLRRSTIDKRSSTSDSSDGDADFAVGQRKQKRVYHQYSHTENRRMINYLIENNAVSVALNRSTWIQAVAEGMFRRPRRTGPSLHYHFVQKLRYEVRSYTDDPVVLREFEKLTKNRRKSK